MGNLTTLATVRQAVPRLAAVADAEITRLIAEASDAIETWCNRTFGTATFTEKFDSDGSGRLFLSNRPITSITSITTGLPNSPVVLSASTYTFNANTGEIQGVGSGGSFWTIFDSYFGGFAGTGFQSVQVIYVGAYTTIPPAVAGRCLALINRAASGLTTDPAYASKTFGRVSYTFANAGAAAALTDEDRRILSLYRNWQL